MLCNKAPIQTSFVPNAVKLCLPRTSADLTLSLFSWLCQASPIRDGRTRTWLASSQFEHINKYQLYVVLFTTTKDVFLCIRISILFNFVSLELYPAKYLMQFTLKLFKVLENLFYPYT